MIGKFLGDQELLILLTDSTGTSTGVLVGLPMEGRSRWRKVAIGLADFLRKYHAGLGDKYWEVPGAWT